MGEAVRRKRVEALEIEERLEIARAGRIAIEHGGQIGAEYGAKSVLGDQHILECLREEPGVHVRVAKALSNAMADCIFKPVMAQHRRVDEACECRLLGHGGLGFRAQGRPNRVGDLVAEALRIICALRGR